MTLGFDTKINRSQWPTLFCSSDFAFYLEVWPQNKEGNSEFALYLEKVFSCIKHHTFPLWVSMSWSFDLKNKWRSQWTLFHNSVILPYILKDIWCLIIILSDNNSVWPKVLTLKENYLYFTARWFLLYILKKCFTYKTPYFLIMSQYELKFWPQNKCRSQWPIFVWWFYLKS